jgi:hypothetical protein
MILILAFAAALLVAAGYALTTSTLARAATAFAALPLVSAGLLIWVALSEDHRGGSRWESAEDVLLALFWASLGVLIPGALLLAYASRRDRRLFAFTAIVLAIAHPLLVLPTMFGFSVD